ncbi:MAG: alpha/beta hydrolase [Synechococcales cyanobacterium M58_A2018_015]|nr:alpha/beta hydrolase [Synechococcales cyanobacterium M58_A2018_015]
MQSHLGPGIGGAVREFYWNWQKQRVTITYEILGEGKPILLLPAFSSVSTRSEMAGLAARLAEKFQVVALDWVGFGDSSRPGFRYRPAVYHAMLKDFVQAVFQEPVVVIAAGHAAGYVMQLAQRSSPPWSWIVLVAPTWRGPLPTAMGEHRWAYNTLRFVVRLPLIGQLLYWLNTLPPFLRWMYQRHVYADPAHITPALIRDKWRTTQRRGARFASAAFVTGALDPVRKRSEFFNYFQPPLSAPVMMVIGEQTPPKSLEEMEILAHFSGVGIQIYRMPGSLGLHEEYADTLADGILPFLQKYLSKS